jgi:hypothetical protein
MGSLNHPPACRASPFCQPGEQLPLLGIKLWQTGVCGAPMEYLNFVNRKNDMLIRLGKADAVVYWDELRRRRTSKNGVFAFKAFIGDYSQTLQDYADLLPHIRSDKTIYLTRQDKLQQAVSVRFKAESGLPSPTKRPLRCMSDRISNMRFTGYVWQRKPGNGSTPTNPAPLSESIMRICRTIRNRRCGGFLIGSK